MRATMKAAAIKPYRPVFKVKTGYCADHRATQEIHAAKGLMRKINAHEIGGAIGEIRAAINPTMVMGVTAGAASQLAMTLMGLMYPEIATMTGAQKTIAAIGGAKTFGLIFGANKRSPAVANTESANPGSRA